MAKDNYLVQVIRSPETIKSFTLSDFETLTKQAFAADLLAYLDYLFRKHCLMDCLPDKFLEHMEAAVCYAEAQQKEVLWEVSKVKQALSPCEIPVVFLKGVAYQLQDLPFAKRRIFIDVDILVPAEKLTCVEDELKRNGWTFGEISDYDNRYYRQWMHELPPLKHIVRNTLLDVHHTIMPVSSRLHPNPELLMADSVEIDGEMGGYVLSPIDMLLHSATHLFHEGEMNHALRDLVDIHELIQIFSEESGFWDNLYDRAIQQQLLIPLYYAVYFTSQILNTPIPGSFLGKMQKSKPGFVSEIAMRNLFPLAALSFHSSCYEHGHKTAKWLLYIRGHYLRMPMYLLLPHLFHKMFFRNKDVV